MIPILYESDELSFTSNGLARLRDCTSCIVKEERNGIYECDFEYPVTGAYFDLIRLGRIIAVTHDDTGNIEPFDIVSASKPINGIVQIHAVHVSYRLSMVTVVGSNINSLAAAFNLFMTGYPSNPFTFNTDKSSEGYMAAADGLPHTVREMMGGIEGSVLDAYGGEYEFNMFNVNLYRERGIEKPFSIRYGVNMLAYNDDLDASSIYTACRPFWTDGTITVMSDGPIASSGQSIDGRVKCVPLDVSEKFETQPTKAQVEAMARQIMENDKVWEVRQTIKVDFVRLSEIGEFEQYEDLLECRLCDSLNVIFPDYGTNDKFKIVSTEWNVLLDRYISMELGVLQATLGQVLNQNNNTAKASGSNAEAFTGTRNTTNTTSGDCRGIYDPASGTVRIVFQCGSNSTANLLPLFTIPQEYRPSVTQYGSIICRAGTSTSQGNCQINAAGEISQRTTSQFIGGLGIIEYVL